MNKAIVPLALFLLTIPLMAFAQEKVQNIDFFVHILGKSGVSVIVGIIFFVYSYRNSIKLFDWIEDQTFGTRDYILQKCELLHIEIEPKKITIILLIMSFGFSIIVFGILAFFGKFMIGTILAAALSFIGWKTPRPFMDSLVKSRIKKYQTQMVDALNLLSNGLRAGLSLPQSLGMVVDELPAPVSQEFNMILQQTKIGVPIEEAFDNLVKRVPTQDNEMFVTSVNILRETGGNLAEVFDTITNVIRERVRLQQKIDTYVAQGKFQGGTIFVMPWAMGLIYFVSDPDSMMPLFTEPVGIVLLCAAIGFNLAGGFVILKIVEIEV
jgi:tight adherence protein B